jgi:hypothetical protein
VRHLEINRRLIGSAQSDRSRFACRGSRGGGGYRDKPGDLHAAARDLNVRYLVDGDLGRLGDLIVVKLALIDALSAKQVWGGRIETPVAKTAAWPLLPIARSTMAVGNPLYEAAIHRLGKLTRRDLASLELVLLTFNADDEGAPRGRRATRATCTCRNDEAARLHAKARETGSETEGALKCV